MTYACPAWEFAAECHLLKLQRLQNKVLRTIGNFPKHKSIRDMHKAFNIPYVYDYIDRLCGLVVRVLGYRFGGPGFDSQELHDFPTKKKKKRKTSSGSGTGFTQPREYN
jgi:hypothetical protein